MSAPDPDAGTAPADRDELLRIAFAILGTREAAEDIVQDALLHHATHAGRAPDAPRAWLRRVTRNLAIDRFRRTRLERDTARLWPDPRIIGGDETLPPEEMLIRRERTREAIRLLLDNATPRDVAAVLLRESFGTDYGELSRAGGRSNEAWRQAVHRTLERARTRSGERADERRRLADEGMAPPAIDGVLERFDGALFRRDPVPLFDALRIDARGSMAIVAGHARATRYGIRARLRIDVDAGGARVSLMLGAVVLCTLPPLRSEDVHRAGPPAFEPCRAVAASSSPRQRPGATP